jgi:DNA repair protein RecN (Recombination protein N)
MLQHLSIRNIVLIEACELEFADGLIVLSGETGAGKSILLDALGLLLGSRGEARLVRHGQAQGSVSGEFGVEGNPAALAVLEELGIEAEGSIVVRRTLSADGKSRCFINDVPVSVTGLRQLGECLVEVHGQHDQRMLMDSGQHLALLDAYGNHGEAVEQLRGLWQHWRAAARELHELETTQAKLREEEDYLRHAVKELSDLAPQEGEELRLTDQRVELMQGEKLRDTLEQAISPLTTPQTVASTLRVAQRTLMRSPLSAGGRFDSVIDALERAAAEADEAIGQLEDLQASAGIDPRELERVEERLFALRGAARKYQCTPDELPAIFSGLESRLHTLDAQVHAIPEARQRVEAARAAYLTAADALHDARTASALRIEQAISAELQGLMMASTRFRVSVEAQEESGWNANGRDAVRFEVATNAGTAFGPLNKIASGGELSRIMLALKAALREMRSTTTMIFDEIDTGTGGATADAIGSRLAAIGAHAQVFVVTHLPQVAARGRQHFRISKRVENDQTFTTVELLQSHGRTEELARMIAGSRITDEARAAAGKLLEFAQ